MILILDVRVVGSSKSGVILDWGCEIFTGSWDFDLQNSHGHLLVLPQIDQGLFLN